MVRLLRSSSRKLRPFKLEHREKLASTEKKASFVAAVEQHVRKPRRSCLTEYEKQTADLQKFGLNLPSNLTWFSIVPVMRGKASSSGCLKAKMMMMLLKIYPYKDGIETPHLK
uniref:Uncharacterized protein n=1 Tax=Cucumis melo TaxID=3656 RepID=A0A9I9E8P5_CUCME